MFGLIFCVTKNYLQLTRKPVFLAGFLLPAFGPLFGSITGVLLATGCTLYSNTDRENFNAKAVVQNPTAASACRVKFLKPLSQDLVTLECFSGESAQTIVRVSR
ncbi:hypothetical protein BH10BDE1_BH10BDE1_01610 [soil metagenome]